MSVWTAGDDGAVALILLAHNSYLQCQHSDCHVCMYRMVRKRKSLPRDSKGFEPIEQYLKEVDEDLNQSSNGEYWRPEVLCGIVCGCVNR